MRTNLLVSVVICTHNRSRYLTQAINSLLKQNTDSQDYEIIVVDNCSTDDTRNVMNEFINNTNNNLIRYIYEAKVGLSYARNAGWLSASGRYVAYLDDDGIAAGNWIESIIDVFENVSPMPGCIGGKSVPNWEVARPEWLSNDLLGGLAVIDWSDTPFFITDISVNWLIGGNIAFPRSVLEQLGGFELGMDRTGEKMLSNGDILIEKQIQKAGYRCYYNPSMEIHHTIQKERLEQGWFTNRYYWQGISDAFMNKIENSLSKKQCIQLLFEKIWEQLKKEDFKIFFTSTTDPAQFTSKCFRLIELGELIGYLKLIINPDIK